MDPDIYNNWLMDDELIQFAVEETRRFGRRKSLVITNQRAILLETHRKETTDLCDKLWSQLNNIELKQGPKSSSVIISFSPSPHNPIKADMLMWVLNDLNPTYTGELFKVMKGRELCKRKEILNEVKPIHLLSTDYVPTNKKQFAHN